MKRRDFIFLIIGILITCFVMTFALYFVSIPKNNYTKEIEYKPLPEGFAVMIYDEEKQDYVESEELPTGGYALNKDKSYCTNGGTIDSYSRSSGTVAYTVEGTDECVIYLDILEIEYLNDKILAIADSSSMPSSQTNGGEYRVTTRFLSPDSSTFTKLNKTDYGNVSMDIADSSVNNIYIQNSDGSWNFVSANGTSKKHHNIEISIQTEAYYQFCYTITNTADTSSSFTLYINDKLNTTSNFDIHSESVAKNSTFENCANIGQLTTNKIIKWSFYFNGTSGSSVNFYLKKSNNSAVDKTVARYQGSDPNNYLLFNGNEVWRIIGVFEGSTLGLENDSYYTKIIKQDSIGAFAYNSSDIEGDGWWEDSDLYSLLNNDYYNRTGSFASNGILDDTKKYIESVPTVIDNMNALKFYQGNGLDIKKLIDEVNIINDPTPVEIVSATDAILSIYFDYYPLNLHYMAINTYAQNYSFIHKIASSFNWTLTQNTSFYGVATYSYNTAVNGLYEAGGWDYETLDRTLDVKPVVYLKSDVYIADGDGSQSNPYQISI